MSEKREINWKVLNAVLIVSLGGAIIYGLPYFRYDYYDVYMETYQLTNTQMGVFGSILGVFGLVSYLFGGVVADRYSTRSILTLSLIGTGIGGLIHLLPLKFWQLCLLYAYWGVTSLFAFWPACIKAVRIVSGKEDQGKAFGIFEGGRGVFAALMTMAAIVAFRMGAGAAEDQTRGMMSVILFYSILTIGVGILTWFVVDKEEKMTSDQVTFEGIGQVIKMPAVWFISITTFCTYVFTQDVYYFTPYMTSFLGASIALGASLASVRRWFAVFGSVGGGFLTDKFGTSKMIFTSFVAMIIGIIAMLLLPLDSSSITLFVIFYLITYTFYNVNSAMTWAMMDEGGIPEKYTGTATGIISTIGYLPEIFVSLLAGHLIDNNPGVAGYRYFFIFVVAMLAVGAIVIVFWDRYLKNRKETNSQEDAGDEQDEL